MKISNQPSHPEVIPKSSQSHLKVIPKSSQSHPKVIPKSSQSHPKVIPKSSQSHSKVIPNSSKSHPKVIQKSSQSHYKVISKSSQCHFKVTSKVNPNSQIIMPSRPVCSVHCGLTKLRTCCQTSFRSCFYIQILRSQQIEVVHAILFYLLGIFFMLLFLHTLKFVIEEYSCLGFPDLVSTAVGS